MAKLRGTEAEIYARLRELAQQFRQVRKELTAGADRQGDVKGAGRPGARTRGRRAPKSKQR